eukprot:CAMPEP_0113543340 /NCGR_PEP_ID=MMETSP0015_2-20120614/10104_1 /TAXON_ID=2838 /ORGANISM="Odontella" /LENGTH=342 /DNA_ID=CAMNT_0000443489 /DNA_START=182 /DNA_END=1211 /DNA_ORIENTATION=+ /assembly_acc=CAM_ASM_000160
MMKPLLVAAVLAASCSSFSPSRPRRIPRAPTAPTTATPGPFSNFPNGRSARCDPSRTAPLGLYQPFTQVISDVDDTLKSSGGVNVAGGNRRSVQEGGFLPGRVPVYAGAEPASVDRYSEVLLVDEEDAVEGGGAAEKKPKLAPAKVAVLTARAEEFKAALELKEDSKLAVAFRTAGERAGYEGWGLGPVLYGSVAEWVVQDRKGMRKFSNFERLLEQDPTGTVMQYIYVGDTGELDQEAGETMLREYPEVVKAVFLHVVSDRPDPVVPPPKIINGRPVVFFRTYVGAAARAAQLGLMDEGGMMRVVAAAEEALGDLNRDSEKWADLNRDITLAYRTLSAESA